MSGISYDQDRADKLVAAYVAPDMVRQRDATLARLQPRPGEHILDIGSGPGFLCESIAAVVGPAGRVVGVDISEDLIRFAVGHKSKGCIDYRLGDALALPFEEAAFDAAVSTQVIEYIADVDAALREMARVLRPGGRGFIVDTDFDSLVWHAADADRMAKIMKGWERHCADPRLPRTLAPRLRAAGFSVTAVEAYPILNTRYDPEAFSQGLSRLIADFVVQIGFDRHEVDDWLADLAETHRRGEYFFSINRYFFSVVKT